MRNKNGGLPTRTMRKSPIVLGVATGLLFKLLGTYAGNFAILSSFGELILAASAFLLLIAVLYGIKTRDQKQRGNKNNKPAPAKRAEASAPKPGGKLSALFAKQPGGGKKRNRAEEESSEAETNPGAGGDPAQAEASPTGQKPLGKLAAMFAKPFKKPGDGANGAEEPLAEAEEVVVEPETEVAASEAEGVQAQAQAVPDMAAVPDDLVAIRRESVSVNRQVGVTYQASKVLFAFYILAFLAGAFWCGTRIWAFLGPASGISAALPNAALPNAVLLNAVLLLVFSAVIAIYLKMRQDNGTRPGDKTSHGLLTLLLCTSLCYAAVIAANSVLGADVLKALPWIYSAVLAYLVIATAVNILLSLLRRDVLGTFDYTFLPGGGSGENVLDSEEAQEKFSLKSLWTIRYTVTILPGLLLLLGVVSFLATSLYVVQPHQKAAVYHFGTLSENSITEQGLHFKLPWPMGKVEIYDVDRINAIQVGYQSAGTADFLWTVRHDSEYLLLLGNGNETVAINMKVLYKITDLYAYVTTCAKPEEILSAVAYEAMMERTNHTTLDAVLSVDRSSLAVSLAEELTSYCEKNALGLTVTQVIIGGIHPPVDLADVYQRVVTASVNKNTMIVNANTEADRLIINAEQQRQAAISQATANWHRRVSSATQEMTVYYSSMDAYEINPECFELTKYIQAYETLISGRKVYVFSPGVRNEISKFIIGKPAMVIPD